MQVETGEAALQVLKSRYGYDQFRFRQAEIVQNLIDGNDALVLMPTGGGKSLCYQIPAIVREGVGIVISPLIALMQDQVNALNTIGIRASFLNSTQSFETRGEVEQQLINGDLDLLYVSPERLNTSDFFNLLHSIDIALFAIDEAHCVSQWGHDFRADYMRLKILHESFPAIPRIALTATADRRTRDEIIQQLELHQAARYIHSFDRPNIFYRISEGQNNRERLWQFIEDNHAESAGIVYCLSRKNVETVADWLSRKGRIALPYHAGMSSDQRAEHQRRFLVEDGVIIVATIAFGMGIDKPDVRFVAHLNLPKTIEAYYQETGRAGRDGLAADAWLAYGMQDVINLRMINQQNEAEESHKILQHSKLEAMLGLCEQVGCRRQTLLAYFDEQLEKPCGHCDNCLLPPTTWDATEAARMALSCVYRTGQRFGTNYVIDILLGKTDERIERNRHDQISTWGIGTELGNNQWRSVFRQLLAFAYLESDSELHGGLRLTQHAKPLLRGEESLHLREVVETSGKRRKRTNRVVVEQTNQPLFERLRSLRKTIAEENGVPPYVIFHDRTLHQMAAVQPLELEQMAELSGVGEKKLTRFGSIFLREIEDFVVGESGDELN
ncbi:MAG: DNA helicase RecQ [Gammaproteobacteria bacterium]|nr:DNA helicase RecQ [Gammaproteobacteria bacterium]